MSAPPGQPFHMKSFQPDDPPARSILVWLARCVPALLLLTLLWQTGGALGQDAGPFTYGAWAVRVPAVLLTVALLPVYGGTLFTFLGHAAGWTAGACGAVLVLSLEFVVQPGAPEMTVVDRAAAATLVSGLIISSAASLCLSARVGKVSSWNETQRDETAQRQYRHLRRELEAIRGQLAAAPTGTRRPTSPDEQARTSTRAGTVAAVALIVLAALGARHRRS